MNTEEVAKKVVELTPQTGVERSAGYVCMTRTLSASNPVRTRRRFAGNARHRRRSRQG